MTLTRGRHPPPPQQPTAMITVEKKITHRGLGYSLFDEGYQTTVRLFGIPVYRRTETVERADENKQVAKADKEPVVIYASKHILLCTEDMSSVTTIVARGGSREPTKWEALKSAYYLWRHFSKGKGLSRNFFTNTWALLRTAPWKASQASWEKETTTAPEPSASHSDTECRPPQQGQTSSEHSRSMERNT